MDITVPLSKLEEKNNFGLVIAVQLSELTLVVKDGKRVASIGTKRQTIVPNSSSGNNPLHSSQSRSFIISINLNNNLV